MDLEDEKKFQQIVKQLFGEDAVKNQGEKLTGAVDNSDSLNNFSSGSDFDFNQLGEEELKAAQEMARYELDQLREAFISFQQEIRELVLLKYSTQFLLDYSSYCEELEELLLSEEDSQVKDNKFMAENDLKKQILTDIYEEYIEQVNDEED